MSFEFYALFKFRRLLLLSGLILSLAAVQAQAAEPDDKNQLKRGAFIYKKFCSLCHGANLEGQANWRIRMENGKLPAPPHDETGHTWHHADSLLFGIIKEGLIPPHAPLNYKTDMPGWGEILKDSDIWAVIAFIKSRWPEKTRKIQEKINQDSLKMKKL